MYPRLLLRGYPVLGPLHLLSRNENGLTFALGYVLQRLPRLLKGFLLELGISRRATHTSVEIRLQESGEEGITDLEIEFPDQALQVMVEAKIDGWPRMAQLSRYARQMTRTIRGEKVLVALGVPPHAPDLQDMNSLDGGVTLRLMRWVDVLSVVDRVEGEAGDEEGSILEELSNLIEEVIGMQSYDREVLIRDMDTQDESFALYLDDNIYACQASERAEPLFFSPCFTNGRSDSQNGIHYFSRVYFKQIVQLGDSEEVQAALKKAQGVIAGKVENMAHRKTADEEMAYLKALPRKWESGLRTVRKHWPKVPTALFFLGDPIRVPNPVKKHGYMIPLGFSMSLERLLTMGQASFRC